MDNINQSAWLAMASLMPINYGDEWFYYDNREGEFFISTPLDYILIDAENKDYEIKYDDGSGSFNFEYNEDVKLRLIDNLKRIEAEDHTLIEIPRVSVRERINIQIAFIKTLDGHPLQRELFSAVKEQQTEKTNNFAINSILVKENIEQALIDKWNDYLTEWIVVLSKNFEESIGMQLSEISIWNIDRPVSVRKVAEIREEPLKPEQKKNKQFGYAIVACIFILLLYLLFN